MAMAMLRRLPLIVVVVLSIPPPAASSSFSSTSTSAQLINDHLAVPPSADEKMPHWLSARLLEDGIVAADAVVSLDGTGNYTSVTAAIAAAPLRSSRRHVIYIKSGMYKEYININQDIWNLMLIGDGMEHTVISGSRGHASGYGTLYTGTVTVVGRGFIARDLRIENTAGAANGQAVALVSESDQSVLYRCSLQGYQDTLYARVGKQFYRECHFSGTVDFIFGDAAAVFQNCKILARLPMPGQENTITAQGRSNADHPTGFTFQFCTVLADDDLLHANFTAKTYLGRPWQNYSTVVFMQSFMSDVVRPDGWLQWNQTPPLDTIYYAEFNNTGPGASINGRVHWPGVHSEFGAEEANKFTVENFIAGNHWLPSTGVIFTPGL